MNTLTPESIQAVRAGFSKIAPIQDEIGGLFYAKLFGPRLHAPVEAGWVAAFDLIRTVMRGGVKAQHR